MQAPMISVPLKATNEIDWTQPLKQYIRQTYGEDPENYAEECATLNRLRQDMRGAGKESASGRDLLYRYYGQLELLDLRFPVDENHIKISFTWFDAFTQKPTSQYSLAYEKASIIFNISAVLSCYAAQQTRSEDSGLKMAYHSFQASAGMFTYINENFLHAPSTDLSRETVKILTQIMLAQGQEVFLEKQIADGKKVGLLAKLASQAAYQYTQVIEGTQENVTKAIFEKVWLLVVQIKSMYMTSLSQYYQALADDDANSHGIAISRLQVAETAAKEANKLANSFPGNVSSNSNLASESGLIFLEITKRHLTNIHEKLSQLIKDNDYIYHLTVPSESGLALIPKLPAAKAIPVSELYAGQDIQRITGPDIFQRIVPISVTESASLYDEEKAKLIRAETERVEKANSEMAASLDYLHLPSALNVIKGNIDQQFVVDDEFNKWCQDIADYNFAPSAFDQIKSYQESIIKSLDKSSHQLDLEESVCEKMRSKYEADWTQQPSSRLTITLRNDIRNYRDAVDEANSNDNQIYAKFCQHKTDFDEMRSAGQMDEAGILFRKALSQIQGEKMANSVKQEASLIDEDFRNDGLSITEQVTRIEDILKKLNLIKRERAQVLKDLKEKVRTDDISQVLILNKKSLSSFEAEIFQSELEKFKPHQSRLLSANHKQSSLMKELTSSLNVLLQDKRVKAEQSKYETLSRQRSSIMSRYRRIYQEFLEYETGLKSAKEWYKGMKDTVDSLGKNVESFVNNRRTEGAQLLNQIEVEKKSSNIGQSMEHERLQNLMGRMSMNSSPSGTLGSNFVSQPSNISTSSVSGHHISSPQSRSQNLYGSPQSNLSLHQGNYGQGVYPTLSHPINQATYSPSPENYGRQLYASSQVPQLPQGYIPPPPPGPPPLLPQQNLPYTDSTASNSSFGYENHGQQGSNDPWSSLDLWK